jgi:hypothetical protein
MTKRLDDTVFGTADASDQRGVAGAVPQGAVLTFR